MKEPIPGILLHCSFESDDICGYTTHDMSGDATVFEQRRGDPLTADHTTHTALGKIKTAIQADYSLITRWLHVPGPQLYRPDQHLQDCPADVRRI